MAAIYRKFGDVRYPCPDILTAVDVLVEPGIHWEFDHNDKEFVVWNDPKGRQPPSWEEIEQEIIKEVKIYNYYKYERDREESYPEIKEQLDLLFHDIKNGNLENGEWIKSIEAVKEAIPKPDSPPPANYFEYDLPT